MVCAFHGKGLDQIEFFRIRAKRRFLRGHGIKYYLVQTEPHGEIRQFILGFVICHGQTKGHARLEEDVDYFRTNVLAPAPKHKAGGSEAGASTVRLIFPHMYNARDME